MSIFGTALSAPLEVRRFDPARPSFRSRWIKAVASITLVGIQFTKLTLRTMERKPWAASYRAADERRRRKELCRIWRGLRA